MMKRERKYMVDENDNKKNTAKYLYYNNNNKQTIKVNYIE